MDDLIKLATGGISSTSAMGEGVTESISLNLTQSNNSTIRGVQKVETIEDFV